MNVDDINPLPAQAERAIVAAEIGTSAALVDHLDIAGLELVRRRMKAADVVRICGVGNLAETRAVCLDAVCRRLVVLGRGSIETYAALGDLLPDVPDFPEVEGV